MASVYKVDVYFIHALAVSSVGLGAFAGYEYLRHKGLPLPDSAVVINKITPIKNFSERSMRVKSLDDPRHEELELTYKP